MDPWIQNCIYSNNLNMYIYIYYDNSYVTGNIYIKYDFKDIFKILNILIFINNYYYHKISQKYLLL